MKYWKGLAGTAKEGQFGIVDDTGSVPDSEQATKAEYDAWVALQPVIPVIDWKAYFASKATAAERITVIAERLGMV